MFFVKNFLIGALLFTLGCGSMTDDLRPSSDDKRIVADSSTTGYSVGQEAPFFSVPSVNGGVVTLDDELTRADAVALYFTMWCPICDSHMTHLLRNAVKKFPGVSFIVVDYVSGSASGAKSMAASTGYLNTPFTIVADTDGSLLNMFNATMGTTIVINKSKLVVMNEDYKQGDELRRALEELL
jgi:peroxiredoxin